MHTFAYFNLSSILDHFSINGSNILAFSIYKKLIN